MIRPAKKLVLETGQEFYGTGFGADCRKVCEIVFNTSVPIPPMPSRSS